MSIPRILHYGFFGGLQPSTLNLRCLASWKRVLPDWEFREWNDANGPDTLFFKRACVVRPVNASNYIRFWALMEFGGIYLDNDVELLGEPDTSVNYFCGFQTDQPGLISVNNAVIGSEKGHAFNMDCVRRISAMDVAVNPTRPSPVLMTERLEELGLKLNGKDQTVCGITVYSKEVLYPWAWFEKPDRKKITNRTVAIHWWEGAWAPHLRHPNAAIEFPISSA